jgi:hypothetical protein
LGCKMKDGKHMMGICAYAYSEPDYVLMKEAGIEWIRVGFSFPFKDKLHGELNSQFTERVEHVKTLKKKVSELWASLRFRALSGSARN